MQRLDDFDRMVMASLSPSGALILPMTPGDGPMESGPAAVPSTVRTDGTAEDSLLPLGLGIVAVVLLASLAALA